MNKASGGDEIPVELFQILKYDAVKVLHAICQQIWKTQQWPQDWKTSVFILIPEKGNAKECSNSHTVALISHASKVMLKILQARLQQYMKHEFPDAQVYLEKAEEPVIKLPASVGSLKKQESSRKNVWFFCCCCSKITEDDDCSYEIKRHLILETKAMKSLDSILKSRDITLPTDVHLVKAMVFPVVMYVCKSWTKES